MSRKFKKKQFYNEKKRPKGNGNYFNFIRENRMLQ